MEANMFQDKRRHILLLWTFVLISLGLNLLILASLYNLRQRARVEVRNAAELLDSVEVENFDLPVHVEESVALSLTVSFSDTFLVPISATVPVSASVPFSDTIVVPVNAIIPVNTTVAVPIPAIGNVTIPIPIVTNIPVNLSVNVPISRSIPVQLEIPVDLLVEIPIESEIPVEADVPVLMDFPVTVPLDEMGMQQLLQHLRDALDALSRILGT
jgi:hypothetical protein